jgi:sucrose-6-phosphate hydrolase SacC (GH32 family)
MTLWAMLCMATAVATTAASWRSVGNMWSVATGLEDRFAPIFHISPALCNGGWTNDPNGPFEFNGVSHMFYQYHCPSCPPGPGPGGRSISWGHVAGNLSHWHCLPPAILPGVDSDGSNTTYDVSGIFTGSVTVVDGTPVATYPGEPGDKMCEASPAGVYMNCALLLFDHLRL